ncbi:MAG: sensor domain-containing protein [Fidelibacterota bacterium]|nr:MAG: sensor domain-containing protein [Candidatus Neomarinimicrobiota bacterium]
MSDPQSVAIRFFRVMGSGQAYLNLVYLLAAFPLGVFYFVFLVTGLSTGLALLIIWVGIPILLLVGAGWWVLANLERGMAVTLLKEDIPTMEFPRTEGAPIWARLKVRLVHPVTWSSLLYLFLKFPLVMATFVIVTTLVSLTLAFLSMPLTYEFLPEFQIGIFPVAGAPGWRIDSMSEALLAVLIGLVLWPATLQITNGLAWIHAQCARVMLSVDRAGAAAVLARNSN